MAFFRRAETPADDDARTSSLLDAFDAAFHSESTSDFEDVVLEGLASDKATRPYPPTGHGYPRRGRT